MNYVGCFGNLFTGEEAPTVTDLWVRYVGERLISKCISHEFPQLKF